MLALVPWVPVAVALATSGPGPGEPTTASCEQGLLGCWDTGVASTLRPALAYVIPCLVVATLLALVALAQRRLRWWSALVLLGVAAAGIVYAAVLG